MQMRAQMENISPPSLQGLWVLHDNAILNTDKELAEKIWQDDGNIKMHVSFTSCLKKNLTEI